MQTGAQLTAGFLLTLPFQQNFSEGLDGFQPDLYLVLVLLAALTTAVVRRAGRRSTDGWPACTSRNGSSSPPTGVIRCRASTCLGLLVTGMVFLIFDVVVDRTSSRRWLAGGCLAIVLLALLVALCR